MNYSNDILLAYNLINKPYKPKAIRSYSMTLVTYEIYESDSDVSSSSSSSGDEKNTENYSILTEIPETIEDIPSDSDINLSSL